MSIFKDVSEVGDIYKGTTEIVAVYKGSNLLYTSKFVFQMTVLVDRNEINVYNEAVAAGWDQTTKLDATIVVETGITVASSSIGTPAFMTGNSFPVGSTIALVNGGVIVGRGGVGGYASAGNPAGGSIYAEYPITITNNNRIAGGGGGGGGAIGPTVLVQLPNTFVTAYAGGGGGANNGPSVGAGGYAGSATAGGGSYTVTSSGSGASKARGGIGGAYGSNGGAGITGNYKGPGGAGGYAISGDSFITWVATGTRNGSIT